MEYFYSDSAIKNGILVINYELMQYFCINSTITNTYKLD